MSETFALEGLLWDAACSIRGPIDAHKFNDCIIPLLFYPGIFTVALLVIGTMMKFDEAIKSTISSGLRRHYPAARKL